MYVYTMRAQRGLGRGIVALAGALALLAAAGPGAARGAPTASSPGKLVPIASTMLDPRLLEVSFAAPNVNPPLPVTKVRILFPTDYFSSRRTYPTLYLLHGAGDNSASWTTNNDGQQSLESFTAAQQAAGRAGVVIVMPDAGQNKDAGWYSNWFNGGQFGPPRWEAYHLEQLISYVERTLRVKPGRVNRAVAGLSMGGFGAMSYAARHPDMFVAAFGFSGFLNTDGIPFLEPAVLAALNSQNGTPTAAVWGSYDAQEVRWRGHNPVDLVPNLHDERLWFATGQGAPGGPAQDDASPTGLIVEGAVYPTNQTFDLALTADGVPHSYNPYAMGGHNWYHFQKDLHDAWPSLLAALASHPAPPQRFDYCSIEPQFSVWGWTATTHRPATEFLSMLGASPAGMTLVGSGSVDLISPPAFSPGKTYRILGGSSTESIVYATGAPSLAAGRSNFCAAARDSTAAPPATWSAKAVADHSGRLHFTVPLGSAHLNQQYTPQEKVDEQSPGYWQVASVRIVPTKSSPPPDD